MTASHQIITSLFSYLCPGLALVWLMHSLAIGCGLKRRGWGPIFLISLICVGLLAWPVRGIPLGRWVAGLNANFSIPLTGLLLAALWRRATGQEMFTRGDWSVGWIFGCIAGFVLYPFALGWGAGDPYRWGWSFSFLYIGSALLTVLLIWKQNRFGLLLLLSIAAYQLHLLESTNYWDYLVDPVYFLLSLFMIGREVTRLWRSSSNNRQAA